MAVGLGPTWVCSEGFHWLSRPCVGQAESVQRSSDDLYISMYVNKVRGKGKVLETFPEVFHSAYSILSSTNDYEKKFPWGGAQSLWNTQPPSLYFWNYMNYAPLRL